MAECKYNKKTITVTKKKNRRGGRETNYCRSSSIAGTRKGGKSIQNKVNLINKL